MPNIVIVGCGYTGERLARRAVGEGWRVTATSRSPSTNLGHLEALGVNLLSYDVLADDAEVIAGVCDAETWVVYSAPTLFREREEPAPGERARHVAPVQAILDDIVGSARGLIYLSSTSVYGDHQGAWIDEDAERAPLSDVGAMRRDIEDAVLDVRRDDFSALVMRLVGIYGPGRTIADYIVKGRYKLVDGGRKVSNRVHVDDIVSAIVAAVARAPSGSRAYNICDGDPRSVLELAELARDVLGIDLPEEVSLTECEAQRPASVVARWKSSYRCAGGRAREELGWEPRWESAMVGLRAIFAEMQAKKSGGRRR